MPDNNISGTRVRVYKDRHGFSADPLTQYLSCDEMEEVGRETLIGSAVDASDCGLIPAGSQFTPGMNIVNLTGVELIETVRLRAKGHGFRWVHPDDYDALITACNACCGT